MTSLTKEVNLWIAKHPLKTNGHFNRGLTSLVKEATDVHRKASTVMSIFKDTDFIVTSLDYNCAISGSSAADVILWSN